jgi:putative intracellular protease/amidase
MEEAFTLEGKTYAAGSLVVARSENGPDLTNTLANLVAETGATLTGFNTSWVTNGPSLGSDKAVKLRNPRILLAWDSPADRNSAGATRYVMERKFGVPVTPVRIRRLTSMALSSYDVVILPDGEASYGAALGEAGARNLRSFVQNGGVLISLGTATAWMADPDVDLIGLRREQATVSEAEAKARLPEPKVKPGAAGVDGVNFPDETAYKQAIVEATRDPTELDGAIVRGETVKDHWLTAGIAPTLHMMVAGSDIYRPLTGDVGDNVVRFAGPDQVKASGIVWDDIAKQLAFKPALAVQSKGRGYVVAFTIDPTYRGMADGLDSLVMNAIYFSAARARPAR